MSTGTGAGALQLVPNAGSDPRIVAFQYSDIVTTFAVVTERYLVFIDTLLNPRMMAAAIELVAEKRAGRRLLAVNTHADWDHAWGNACFEGVAAPYPAPIVGHHLCRTRLESETESARLRRMQGEEPELYADAVLVPPTITIRETAEIHGGDLTLQLLHTPGHQPDHLAVFVPEIATLFSGDAAEYPLPFVESGRTLAPMTDSLRRMQSLAPEQVLYCHAPGRYDASVIELNLAYFDELQRRAAARPLRDLPADTSDDELAAAIDFTWERACELFGFRTQQQEFYRGAHRSAVRAAVDALRPT